ncbi:MAG TPA: sulfite exporter TauE/SafE family protein, partial [Candidatus Nanopelagicales bacterium]|nr:sulfite exporter TauE/SafE family protein [Candidatus Nanopelagicales bacterium]
MIESYDVLLAVGGLVAGLMVGLTGMGGAVLVTPLLILGFGVPAAAAVSSDVVAAAVMKPVGASVHIRRRTVHWGLVLWLSVGSVPGVLIGTLIFSRLTAGSGIDQSLRTWIGLILLVALVAMVAKSQLLRHRPAEDISHQDARRGRTAPINKVPIALLGLVVGTLVGTTSVGSGSLVVTVLLLMYPLLRPSVLVGTDLVQAAPMLIVGALAHAGLGDVDWRITAALLVGQVPGVWIGARMS